MAAFLDGNLCVEEMKNIRDIIKYDSRLCQIVDASDYVDDMISCQSDEIPTQLLDDDFEIPQIKLSEQYPFTALAAYSMANNLCDIHCEGYILRKFEINVSDDILKAESERSGWLTPNGTQLQYIGELAKLHGLRVERKYHASYQNIVSALVSDCMIMVCVDEGELIGNTEKERIEDIVEGKRPDHVVIVSAIDVEKNEVTIVDPYTPQLNDSYSFTRFQDAWDDSENYMVTIHKR